MVKGWVYGWDGSWVACAVGEQLQEAQPCRHMQPPSSPSRPHTSHPPTAHPHTPQVFTAVQSWRQMLPASEVVKRAAQGEEARHAAHLMGLTVDPKQRRNEDELIAMRVGLGGWCDGLMGDGWVGVAPQ